MVHVPGVFDALLMLDNNIQKLDAGTDRLFHLINNPVEPVNLDSLVQDLARFNGKVIIQGMFLRGTYHDEPIDNTTEEEVSSWLEKLNRIRPSMVMIYPIDRATPVRTLEKIPERELNRIAERVASAGLKVSVY